MRLLIKRGSDEYSANQPGAMTVADVAAARHNQVPLGIAYKVGIHRWSALMVGFVGVLMITHPGTGTLTYGALFALGNAVLISTVAIAIRRMSMTESAETLTLYQMSIMTLCTAGLLTLGFQAPHLGDALMLALAGVGNGIAQFWWTRSLSLAPPSAVVPFNYLSLVWAMILGFAVWGDVPTPGLLVGSAIVVASGVYILWRETVIPRRPPALTALATDPVTQVSCRSELSDHILSVSRSEPCIGSRSQKRTGHLD